MTDHPSDRLREARTAAGYTSSRAFAEAHGFPPSSYAKHENGDRNMRTDVAKRYAKHLGVSWYWLLTGEHLPDEKRGNAPTSDDVRLATHDIITTVKAEGMDADADVLADSIWLLAQFYAERDGDPADRLRLTIDGNVILFPRRPADG